jgi:hypothetical protein
MPAPRNALRATVAMLAVVLYYAIAFWLTVSFLNNTVHR